LQSGLEQTAHSPTCLRSCPPPGSNTPPPATLELTDAELKTLGEADASDLNLSPEDRQSLENKRREVARAECGHGLSALQRAQLHGFRLYRSSDNGKVYARCLLCPREKEAQEGAGRFFLNNFIKHIRQDKEHLRLAAEARGNLASCSAAIGASRDEGSAGGPDTSGSTTRSGLAFGVPTPEAPMADLTETQLRLLAAFDDPRLSPAERDAVAELRVWVHQTLDGGVMAHRFRLTLVDELWRVDCEACGTRSLAYTAGHINFLNHFQRHLTRPTHRATAARRLVAICNALLDAATMAAADAQEARSSLWPASSVVAFTCCCKSLLALALPCPHSTSSSSVLTACAPPHWAVYKCHEHHSAWSVTDGLDYSGTYTVQLYGCTV
jgi:hypothetical protein